MAQWAKRPPLKQAVSGSSPRGWFNGRAGNRDPFRWLETARGLSPIRLIGRAQYFPGGLAFSSLKRVSISHPFAVSAKKDSFAFLAGHHPSHHALGGRPRGTVGKASASEARGPGFEPPWLVQRSRWKSRPLSLVGNGAGAGTLLIDRAGTVFPRGTGRFLVIKGVLMHSFAISAKKYSVAP